jgi:hypothetical protein
MTGWWFVGSVGEALFFAAFFLIGVMCFTTVVGWQFLSPTTQVVKIGYGFWLLTAVAVAFIVMGAVGFWYRVLKVATSDEHREVIAKNGLVSRQPVYGQPRREARISIAGRMAWDGCVDFGRFVCDGLECNDRSLLCVRSR